MTIFADDYVIVPKSELLILHECCGTPAITIARYYV